jgi:hypothetical protein
MIAAGLNLKRLLKKRGWGCRPFPAQALCAFFLVFFLVDDVQFFGRCACFLVA